MEIHKGISTMKAVVFTQFGGPEVLHISDVPDPIAGPGEVLVTVHAASINGADHKVRRGDSGYKANFPHILGRDFSGVISAIGSNVHDLAVGDAVFGVLDRGVEGTYAEKLVTQAAIIARKPDWLGHVEAAAIALAGITAIWAVEDTANLRQGETTLIQGGAGGVGAGVLPFLLHATMTAPLRSIHIRALTKNRLPFVFVFIITAIYAIAGIPLYNPRTSVGGRLWYHPADLENRPPPLH